MNLPQAIIIVIMMSSVLVAGAIVTFSKKDYPAENFLGIGTIIFLIGMLGLVLV